MLNRRFWGYGKSHHANYMWQFKMNDIHMNVLNEVEWSVEEEVAVAEDVHTEEARDLMVYNDDFNTFEHVIETLIRVCEHDMIQAEQCTHLIHFKGKCCVKKGSFDDLRPMRQGITEAGIKAVIL
jgi:ATP-dependent Clp protease adaptor protein ClpS